MSRSVSSIISTALSSNEFSMAFACDMDIADYDSGSSTWVPNPLRVNTTPSDLTLNGNVYTGFGQFANFSPVSEDNSLQSTGLSITLNGLNPTTVPNAVSSRYQGRIANLFLLVLDTAYNMSDSILLGSWAMDTMSINIGAEASIIVKCESKLVDWSRPNIRYFSDADHTSQTILTSGNVVQPNATDTFFSLMPTFLDKQLLWGRK